LFRRLTADLRAVQDGAEVDMILLGDMLRLRDRLEQVRVQLAADGPTAVGSKGQVRPHPLLQVEQNLARDVRTAMDQLGLTPAKRGRYTRVTAAGRLHDPYAELDEYDDE
jgi:P27 family predicted phage terminase small subunit